MDINSKRFSVKSDGFGTATIRDRNAPYHVHTVKLTHLPTVEQLAMMTEARFDSVMSRLVYGRG